MDNFFLEKGSVMRISINICARSRVQVGEHP